ncbi:MAG: RNB domain-containing ribonuclease, partial [Bacteroidales bacterium]|nr:RNB domain-containing ribonuclease [Bacteroidales bacterium]
MARKNEQYRKSSASEISSDILAIFRKSPKKPLNCKQVAVQLGINNKEGLALTEKHLATLEQKGELQECQKGKYRLKNQMGTITGHIDMTPYGTAYVVSPQLEEDVFIASPNLNHALNNDLVKVSLFAPHGRRSRLEGEVVEILEEGRREFVGIIERNSKYAFVIVDKRYIPYDIFVANDDAMDAKNGQKVVVQIVEWPKKAKNPIGKVVKVLGDVGNNETEMHAILEEFDLPYHFTKELEDEANALPDEIPAAEIKSRRDFRDVTTFTIDPADAKDFDDALSIEFLEDETYRIGVHIADVTYYVRPGSKLEEEAQKRATSVYLVDRVVPMLPEKLSNNVCSLRPNEDKLTFSAVFIMDKEANVMKEWFGRTIIRSNRRFSYEQAQQVIET